jgi:hypothetical protein
MVVAEIAAFLQVEERLLVRGDVPEEPDLPEFLADQVRGVAAQEVRD